MRSHAWREHQDVSAFQPMPLLNTHSAAHPKVSVLRLVIFYAYLTTASPCFAKPTKPWRPLLRPFINPGLWILILCTQKPKDGHLKEWMKKRQRFFPDRKSVVEGERVHIRGCGRG